MLLLEASIMETRKFIDQVKVEITKEYVKELTDAYLLSMHAANTMNAFDNLVFDDSLVGNFDANGYSAILSRLLNAHEAAGGTYDSFLASLISNPIRTTFNYNEITKQGTKKDRFNKFSIAVNANNIFRILDKVLAKAEELNYAYDIDIPVKKQLNSGVVDTINIYAGMDNLEETLAFLDALTPELDATLTDSPSKTMKYTPKISYDTFDIETGKWGRDVIGEELVAAIDIVISSAVENARIQVSLDDANYYNNETDMTSSYLYMKDLFDKSGVDFYQAVTDYLTETLKSLEIDPTNIFMAKAFVKKLYLLNKVVPNLYAPVPDGSDVYNIPPTSITYEGQDKTFEGTGTPILGEDDIPDLPVGFTPVFQAPPQSVSPTPSFGSEMPQLDPTSPETLRGPEMMLIPSMLERHHSDGDLKDLYQSFLQVKDSETQLSAKIMQLNVVWPDLTYADFVAFRQFDRNEDFIPNGFIQLWVDTKQQGQMPSVSSEELYKNGVVQAAPAAPAADGDQPASPEATPVIDASQPVAPSEPVAPVVDGSQSMATEVTPVIDGSQTVAPAAPGSDAQIQQLPVQGANGKEQGTGMYTDSPVEVQPIENPLTPGEAQAMMQVGNEASKSMDLNKYSFFPTPEVTLAQPVVDVDGATITLYDYLEKYNVLGVIPRTATITTAEGQISADDFIVNNLARFVVTNGATSVEDYIELFNIQIVNKEPKKGLFGKILNKR